jgi:hypothetical protein
MTDQPEQSHRSDRASRPDPIGRVLEVAVYAPIGVASYVRDMGPDLVRTVVARGRAEVDTRQEQVVNGLRHAKGAGEVAIAFGLPVLRRKVGERLSSLRPSTEAPPAPRAGSRDSDRPEPTRPVPPTAPTAPVPTTARATVPRPGNTNGHRSADPVAPVDPATAVDAVGERPEERLAIPGYDALSASQVVERLAGLSGDELAAVRDYEAGHRRRRTVLGKIEQLSI